MRKSLHHSFMLALLYACVLIACKKQERERPSLENSSLLNEVFTWLDNQNEKFRDAISHYEIDRLKKSLIGSALRVETVSDRERWIEIPLTDTFRTQYQQARPALKMLVLRQLNDGQFFAGQIVEVIADRQPYIEIPVGLIVKARIGMKTVNSVACSGLYPLITKSWWKKNSGLAYYIPLNG